MTDRLTLSIEEAAHALGIGRGLAYQMARSGELPVVRVGRRRLLVPRDQLEALLREGLVRRHADASDATES